MRCAFCELPEIKERIITRNEHAVAFPTNIPVVPGHVLICPLRCVVTFDELTREEREAILDLREKITAATRRVFHAEGFHFAWNEGSIAGQSVPHFHLHVIPRKKEDTGITDYEPRQFIYRPGSREPSPEKELQEVARVIRNALF